MVYYYLSPQKCFKYDFSVKKDESFLKAVTKTVVYFYFEGITMSLPFTSCVFNAACVNHR